MNIVVCIKQVPDTCDIKWTENNTLKRDEMDSVINPFDEFGLETALKIKDKIQNTKITTISMGPKQAEKSLKESIALGCDKGILLCDKKFAAADTVATSKTISAGIKKYCTDFDLIICGQFATDGDTAQTGVGIAENLSIPQVTYVKDVIEIDENEILVEKENDYGIQTIKVKLPALICIQKGNYYLRQAKINGYIKAQETEIKQVDKNELDIDENTIGIKGSPTFVKKAFRPQNQRKLKIINSNELIDIIKEVKNNG